MLPSKIDCGSPLILCNQQMEEVRTFGFLNGCVALSSTRGPGKTSANEDAAALVRFDEGAGALIVADGMGGHAAGEVAARIAIEQMVLAIEESANDQALLRTGIINGFERANHVREGPGYGRGNYLGRSRNRP